MPETLTLENPTAAVNLDFGAYLAKRKSENDARLEDGVPKYSFSLDRQLRQQFASIKPVRAAAQFLASASLPMKKQTLQMEGVVASPTQYADVYKIVEEAAERFNIGVPTVLILPSAKPSVYTVSSNQTVDLIVLDNSVVESFKPDELRFIVGRECGHIHNLHSGYYTAATLLATPSSRLLQMMLPSSAKWVMRLISTAASYYLLRWMRCAEVTCDRAGLICCGDLATAEMTLLKLYAGSGFAKQVNVEEFLRQEEESGQTTVRLAELKRSEPLMQKRIKALRLFAESDTLLEWRPEMKTEKTRTRADIDADCEKIFSVL
jgi:Zn-dependent protease with chaperone function